MLNTTYDTENAILLLKSIGINYPVLKEYGLELTKPLLVVIDRGQLKAAVSMFSEGDALMLNEFMKVRDCKKVFSAANSTFVLFPYSQSRKGRDFLAFLSCIARVGAMEETPINAMPLILSEGVPYDCDMEDFFSVFITGSLGEVHIDEKIVVPPDKQLAVVEDKINIMITDNFSQDEKAFMAAACILYPNMIEADLKKRFYDVINCARRLAKVNEDNQCVNGLGDAFIRELYYWQEQNAFHDVFELPNLEMSTEEKLDEVILFDERFLYISEKIFKEISRPLIKIFAVDIFKRTLMQEGILCPDNTSTYTVKMPYYNLIAEYKRKRMLRFSRNKLNHLGELDFLDKCKYQK